MPFNPNISCINFELENIDHQNQGYIEHQIGHFVPDNRQYNTKSVSVSLTKENRYLVVAVIEFSYEGLTSHEPNDFEE